MNKIKNLYYLKVAVLFSFLSCFMPIIFWHLYLWIAECRFEYDDKLTIVYFFIFLIQSGIYLLSYGLGRWLNNGIKSLIIFFSFCDFVVVFLGLLLLSGIAPSNNHNIFSNFGFDLYFILLFLSKFWLIYILKCVDKKIEKEYQKEQLTKNSK